MVRAASAAAGRAVSIPRGGVRRRGGFVSAATGPRHPCRWSARTAAWRSRDLSGASATCSAVRLATAGADWAATIWHQTATAWTYTNDPTALKPWARMDEPTVWFSSPWRRIDMHVVVDGQAWQTSAGGDADGLLAALMRLRPRWTWSVIEAAHLPPLAQLLPAGVARLTFTAPVADVRRRTNQCYYGDWLLAQQPTALLIVNFWDRQMIVPHFGTRRPFVVGCIDDLTALRWAVQRSDAESRRWCCVRLRAVQAADALVVPSVAVAEEVRDLCRTSRPRHRGACRHGPAPLSVYRQALDSASEADVPALPRGRRRIAWVSPLPPTPSGIADYSADLLPALASRYDIDLVIDPQQPAVDPVLAVRHRVLTAAEAMQRHAARPYDLFVYQIGNSGYHAYMLDLMRRYRGLVVLHDFYLGGLVALVSRRRPVADSAGRGTRRRRRNASRGLASTRVRRCLCVAQLTPLNRRLLGLAAAVVVHSAWSGSASGDWWTCPSARTDAGTVASVGGSEGAFASPARTARCGVCRRIAGTQRPCQAAAVAAARCSRLTGGDSGTVPGCPRWAQWTCRPVPSWQARQRRWGWAGRCMRRAGSMPRNSPTRFRQPTFACSYAIRPWARHLPASCALAAETPCITSDQGPMAELPDHVVPRVRSPYREVADLTRHLLRLYTNPAQAPPWRRRPATTWKRTTRRPSRRRIMPQSWSKAWPAAKRDDAEWLEATAALLESEPLAGQERDALLADWAALRERATAPCQPQTAIRRRRVG